MNENNETSCNYFKRARSGGDGGDDLTNVQRKAIRNCHSDPSCTMDIS
jgi:hypothetical protein